MQCVNINNWTFCRYRKGNFHAQVTFGADPESLLEDRWDYFVTVLEDEIEEVFQHQFSSLAEACIYLNSSYSDWTFEDQAAPKSGCSSCAAH